MRIWVRIWVRHGCVSIQCDSLIEWDKHTHMFTNNGSYVLLLAVLLLAPGLPVLATWASEKEKKKRDADGSHRMLQAEFVLRRPQRQRWVEVRPTRWPGFGSCSWRSSYGGYQYLPVSGAAIGREYRYP